MQECFTIGISSRALFDLEAENAIFENQGVEAYVDYQIAHEKDVLAPGAAFALIQSFLALNQHSRERQIEVVIMSKNSADAALRIFHSIEYYELDITRAALTSGAAIAPYLQAYGVDLYLSYNAEEVKNALQSGIAAGVLLPREELKNGVPFVSTRNFPGTYRQAYMCGQIMQPLEIRIAFDGDAVLFSGEAERTFQEQGVEAFCTQERDLADVPLRPGPFAHVLQLISALQRNTAIECTTWRVGLPEERRRMPVIRTALVTARSAPAHERVIRTLRTWGIRIDEAFFMGGMDKSQILEAFGAHIFFDDNEENVESASAVVLSARVPWVDETMEQQVG